MTTKCSRSSAVRNNICICVWKELHNTDCKINQVAALVSCTRPSRGPRVNLSPSNTYGPFSYSLYTTRLVLTSEQIDLEGSDDDIREIQQEISLLSTCASEYVTSYKASFVRGTKLWIVMEFLGGGSCLDLVCDLSFVSSTGRLSLN